MEICTSNSKDNVNVILLTKKKLFQYQLFTFWFILVLLAVAVLTMRTQLAVKASTVTRKSFHVLASAVFLSGILVDLHLMILASGIVFGLLILLEVMHEIQSITLSIFCSYFLL